MSKLKFNRLLKLYQAEEYHKIVREAGSYSLNGNSKYLNLIGASYLKVNEAKKAFPFLKSAVKKDPGNISIVNNFSEVCSRLNQSHLVSKSWDHPALLVKPPEYLPSYAHHLYQTGQIENAYSILEKINDNIEQPEIYHDTLISICVQYPQCVSMAKMKCWKGSQYFISKKSLTVKTKELIGLYLATNIGSCYEALGVLTSPAAVNNYKLLNKKNKQFVAAYVKFIASLIPFLKKIDHSTDEAKIFCVGDSHSLTYHGHSMVSDSCNKQIVAKLIFGAKVYHLISEQPNAYKALLNRVVIELTGQSVMFSFGEIDFRENEGLMQTSSGDKIESARQMALSYIDLISDYRKNYNLNAMIVSVPFPLRQPAEEKDTYDQRLECLKIFNQTLETLAAVRAIKFINTFEVENKINAGQGSFHIDNRHLSPKILEFLET